MCLFLQTANTFIQGNQEDVDAEIETIVGNGLKPFPITLSYKKRNFNVFK